MKTPNYVLDEDFSIPYGHHDVKVLPAGTFVRPIETCYVPKHIKDENKWFNEKTDCYCYTRIGIIVIPKKYVRKV